MVDVIDLAPDGRQATPMEYAQTATNNLAELEAMAVGAGDMKSAVMLAQARVTVVILLGLANQNAQPANPPQLASVP